MANETKTYRNTRTGDVHTTSDVAAQARLESYPDVWEQIGGPTMPAKPPAPKPPAGKKTTAKKAAANKAEKVVDTAPGNTEDGEGADPTGESEGEDDGASEGDADAEGAGK